MMTIRLDIYDLAVKKRITSPKPQLILQIFFHGAFDKAVPSHGAVRQASQGSRTLTSRGI